MLYHYFPYIYPDSHPESKSGTTETLIKAISRTRGQKYRPESEATLPPFSLPANESLRRTGLHLSLSAKSCFNHPAVKISLAIGSGVRALRFHWFVWILLAYKKKIQKSKKVLKIKKKWLSVPELVHPEETVNIFAEEAVGEGRGGGGGAAPQLGQQAEQAVQAVLVGLLARAALHQLAQHIRQTI